MNTCTPRCTPVEFIHWSVNPKRHEFAFLIRTETTRNGEVEKGIEKNRRRNELKETPATQRKIPKNSQCKTHGVGQKGIAGWKGKAIAPLSSLHFTSLSRLTATPPPTPSSEPLLALKFLSLRCCGRCCWRRCCRRRRCCVFVFSFLCLFRFTAVIFYYLFS